MCGRVYKGRKDPVVTMERETMEVLLDTPRTGRDHDTSDLS